MQLESELAMTSGAQATLSKQALELQNENSQLKEELVFLQKLVADSNKQVGLSIQRLAVERERDDAWHYSMLVVRGGNPKDEFEGNLTLQVTVQPRPPRPAAPRPTIADAARRAAGPRRRRMSLNFKYYQRVEGTFPVPAEQRGARGDRARVRVGTAESAGHAEPCDSVRRTHVGT